MINDHVFALTCSDKDCEEMVNKHGGVHNEQAFALAAAEIVRNDKIVELKTYLLPVSKGNIEVAANMLQDQWNDVKMQDNIIDHLLESREPVIENFRWLAELVLTHQL